MSALANYFIISAGLGAISSFLVMFLKVSGTYYWIQARASKIVYKALECDFCSSFWFSLLFNLIFCIFVADIWYVVLTPLSATIHLKLRSYD